MLAPHQDAVELFRPPDSEQLFRLSAHAIATSEVSALVGRAVARAYDPRADLFVPERADRAWSTVAIGAKDSRRHVLFHEFPMSGPAQAAWIHHEGTEPSAPPFAVFAFVDVDRVDTRDSARPLTAAREVLPFTTTFARPIEGEKELRLHTLVPNVVELVSLKCLIPPQGVVELRFYDGTFRAGKEFFIPVRLKNYSETRVVAGKTEHGLIAERKVLVRHPMRGPGSIRAYVLAQGEESPSLDLPYGFYFSGSTVR